MNSRLSYRLTPRTRKAFKKIKKRDQRLYRKIVYAVERIRVEPYIGERKSGDLKGIYSLDIKHVGTNYELAYVIKVNENGDFVLILLFGTRENFYNELRRYIK